MRPRSSSVTTPAVSSARRRCRVRTSLSANSCSRDAATWQAVVGGFFARSLAAPDHHLHAERLAVAGHQLADLAVSPDAQRAPAQHDAQAEVRRHRCGFHSRLLPAAVLERADVLGQPAHGRHDQRPGELGRRDRGTDALRDGDAALRAGLDVDVRADAAGLRNQAQAGQFFEELARDVGALADQHDDVRVTQADRQLADPLDGVGVDLGGIGFELRRAVKFAHRVLVVVEDHNVHSPDCASRAGRVLQSRRTPDSIATSIE